MLFARLRTQAICWIDLNKEPLKVSVNIPGIYCAFHLNNFSLVLIHFKDVSAGYNHNELLFAYKSLMENRNGSNPINIGDADGRRNVMSTENSKRSSLSNEIPK